VKEGWFKRGVLVLPKIRGASGISTFNSHILQGFTSIGHPVAMNVVRMAVKDVVAMLRDCEDITFKNKSMLLFLYKVVPHGILSPTAEKTVILLSHSEFHC
jgi:hypothetical protein